MPNFKSVAQCFSKVATSYNSHAHMQNAMGKELLAFLQQTLRCWGFHQEECADSTKVGLSTTASTISTSPEALAKMHWSVGVEIGCGPGNFTQELLSKLSFSKLILNDLSPQMLELAYSQVVAQTSAFNSACALSPLQVDKLEGNILDVYSSVPSIVDLIVSNAVLQWLPLAEALAMCRKLAKLPAEQTYKGVGTRVSLIGAEHNKVGCGCCNFPERDYRFEPMSLIESTNESPHVLAFSSFSAGNFAELKQLGHAGLDYLALDEVHSCLERYTKRFVLGYKSQRQYFTSSTDLFRHLKLTGVNGVGKTLNAGRMRTLIKDYDRYFRDQNGVYLTWRPYYVVAML